MRRLRGAVSHFEILLLRIVAIRGPTVRTLVGCAQSNSTYGMKDEGVKRWCNPCGKKSHAGSIELNWCANGH